MKKSKNLILFAVWVVLLCTSATFANAAEISFNKQGGINLNGPSYGWWYGCTATSAGMMMGYYDQKGYGGLSYSNLVPGGVAEVSTAYGDGVRNALVKEIIASQGHVNDYYRYWDGSQYVPNNNAGFGSGYGWSGDDVAAPTHTPNSLADFMGTSQDAAGNTNGSTTLYYWTNGARFTAQQAFVYGVSDFDGMYGIDEYFRYAGYSTGSITTDTSFFTQLIWNPNLQYGFTFNDYKAEIDAGRVVMIHVEGHSMFGYGYTDAGQIVFDDTWNGHDLLMNWGGSYDGMSLWGVTCFTPTGGTVVTPLPSSLLLLGPALFGLLASRIRSNN